MSQIPNLDNAPINLSLIRDKAQEELIDALDSVKGKKVLYLDPKLSGPLALIAQTSLLKEHGVENLFHLAAEPVQSECRNVMYLVRPRVSLMKTIAEQIRHDKDLQIPKNYSIYFMPRITRICQKILEANEVLGDVTLREFPLYFIPFDEDVLSLELDTAYKEYRVEGDTSALWYVARAISNLQLLFGVIPNVKAKGKAASQVAEMLKNMHKENPGITYGAGIPEIDTVILLDRHVDMVTPMCSQLTYEGLLDEFLHINNGTVEVDSSIILASSQNTKKQVGDKKIKVPLNSSDKLYRELRDLNFGVVGQVLQRKTTTMKNDYAEVSVVCRWEPVRSGIFRVLHYLSCGLKQEKEKLRLCFGRGSLQVVCDRLPQGLIKIMQTAIRYRDSGGDYRSRSAFNRVLFIVLHAELRFQRFLVSNSIKKELQRLLKKSFGIECIQTLEIKRTQEPLN